ncbi:M24 family metallopeptidase [Thalassoroseus pseudoceratinae]|uniref:M24 family metallopeptidase n=1 Tax=Thalassoroseus pseudoceratinae TaxID=2713176 RepID=UPI0014237917|nr:Xaa-Pro peptidase family protein [Thalassoroseus pseudoceratinae]
MLQISNDEYQQRLTGLQEKIQRAELDVFVVSAFESIYYLTGAGFEPLERPFFLLVFPNQPPTLLVPKLDERHMQKARNLAQEKIQTYRDYPAPEGQGWPERLLSLLEGHHMIGVEPSLRQDIESELPRERVCCKPLVEELRSVKSPMEIQMIARAARYADFGVNQLFAASYNGSTVAEGFARTRQVTARIIRETPDWDPITTRVLMATWAAPQSAMPHSIPQLADRLEAGPHVALVLTRVNGYAAESERTYFTQRPSPESRRVFKAMQEARRIALGMLRPGASCAEIDGSVNAFLSQEGFGGEDQRLHRTGHGFGLSHHEGPFLAEGSTETLAEDMVVSIEPGIYLEGFGGCRHSDTIRVTRDGYELLTNAPQKIEDLTMTAWKPRTRIQGQFIRRALRVK